MENREYYVNMGRTAECYWTSWWGWRANHAENRSSLFVHISVSEKLSLKVKDNVCRKCLHGYPSTVWSQALKLLAQKERQECYQQWHICYNKRITLKAVFSKT
jgi:hypothetical protein